MGTSLYWPYIVERITSNGAYTLRDIANRRLLDRTVPSDQIKLVSKYRRT